MKKLMTILAASFMLVGLAGCGNNPTTYRVTYDANGATSGEVPVDSKSYTKDSDVTVLDNGTLEKVDYEFTCWNTAADGSGLVFNTGDSFKITSNTVLYAQWLKVKFTVTYDANGATSGQAPVDTQKYSAGDMVTIKDNGSLIYEKHEFLGWNTDFDGSGILYDVGDEVTITGDLVLYATWQAESWDVDVKEFLAKHGTIAPIESIANWASLDGGTVDYGFFKDKTGSYAEVTLTKETEMGLVSSVFEEDLMNELFASKNWAGLSVDTSMMELGVFTAVMFAKPNDETNKFTIMEVSYISETSLYTIFGYDAAVTFYFYARDGYNAKDATSLLVEGVVDRFGGDNLLNKNDLSSIAESFIVDAVFTDPTNEEIQNDAFTLGFAGYEVSLGGEGIIEALYETTDTDAKNDAEKVLKKIGFSISTNWVDMTEEIGSSAFGATFTKAADYEADVIIGKMSDTAWALVIQIRCVNTSLFILEEFTMYSFGYNTSKDSTEEFISLIDTNNYTVVTDFAKTQGCFAFSNNTIKGSNQIVEADFGETNGNFSFNVRKANPVMKEWPIESINKLFSAPFETSIPTIDFVLGWSAEVLEEDVPYVGVVLLDPADPSDVGNTLFDKFNNEMLKHAEEWDFFDLTDDSSLVYQYVSKEENAAGELISVAFTETEGQLVIQYTCIVAPQTWDTHADKIAAFINTNGFKSTVVPAGVNEKIWNFEDGLTYLVLGAVDSDGVILDDYIAKVTDDDSWNIAPTVISVGWYDYDGYVAESIETNEGGDVVRLLIFNDYEYTYIQIDIVAGPVPFPTFELNSFINSLGFTQTVVPDISGTFSYGVEDNVFSLRSIVDGEDKFLELAQNLDKDQWNVTISDDGFGTSILTATSKEVSEASEDGFSYVLSLKATTDGTSFSMTISTGLCFPVDSVNTILESQGWGSNVLPEKLNELICDSSESLISYDPTDDSYFCYFWIEDAANYQEMFNALVEAFVALGCDFDDSSADWGDYYLTSADWDIYVYISDWGAFGYPGTMEISITVYPNPDAK